MLYVVIIMENLESGNVRPGRAFKDHLSKPFFKELGNLRPERWEGT